MDIQQRFLSYSAEKSCLQGKNILVTGAGAGIGRQAALTFAEHGATVILLGRTMAKLEAVYDEIEKAGHPKPAIYPMNLEGAVEQDFLAMYDALNQEFSALHGILHNASELGSRTNLSAYPLSDWQKLLQVNLTAPFLMTKALFPLLQKADTASVVFTGSSVGLKGRAYWGAYAMTKAAQENMMQTWADELEGMGAIRMNSINPGATRTGMRALAYPAEDPSTIAAPVDLIGRYLFLFSDASVDVSGHQFDAQPK